MVAVGCRSASSGGGIMGKWAALCGSWLVAMLLLPQPATCRRGRKPAVAAPAPAGKWPRSAFDPEPTGEGHGFYISPACAEQPLAASDPAAVLSDCPAHCAARRALADAAADRPGKLSALSAHWNATSDPLLTWSLSGLEATPRGACVQLAFDLAGLVQAEGGPANLARAMQVMTAFHCPATFFRLPFTAVLLPVVLPVGAGAPAGWRAGSPGG